MPKFTNPLLKELRAWQPEAIERMISSSRFGVFDTVGIGKTIETIAASESLKYKTLIVCESSTISQWKDEIFKFSGHTAFIVKSESKSKRQSLYKQFARSESRYLILGYGKIRVDFDDIKQIPFQILVFDEAAILSNLNKTKDYALWLSLKRKHVYILTATPISRDIMQFYDLFYTIGYAPISREEFMERFAEVEYQRIYTKRGAIAKPIIKGAKNLSELKQLYGPNYIKRSKKDISEFIDETIKNYYYRVFEMSKEQNIIYEKIKDGFIQTYRKDTIDNVQLNALSAYNYIIQSLGSPYLVDNRLPELSPKISGLLELLPTFEKNKIFIFAKHREFGKIIEKHIRLAGLTVGFIHGELDDQKFEAIKRSFTEGSLQVLIATEIAEKGLNLQVAHNAVFMDLPPVPDSIFQLIGRVDRIGQVSPFINVYFMLMNDTVEYNLFRTLKDRQSIFDELLNESLSHVFDLTTKELIKML